MNKASARIRQLAITERRPDEIATGFVSGRRRRGALDLSDIGTTGPEREQYVSIVSSLHVAKDTGVVDGRCTRRHLSFDDLRTRRGPASTSRTPV